MCLRKKLEAEMVDGRRDEEASLTYLHLRLVVGSLNRMDGLWQQPLPPNLLTPPPTPKVTYLQL